MAILFLYGTLVAIPLALNLAASRIDYGRHVDAVFASGMLCVLWALTNAIGVLYEFPQSKQFHSLLDLIALSAMVGAYMTQRQAWKLALCVLFLAQLAAHAVFWWMWWHTPTEWHTAAWRDTPLGSIGRGYMATLNVLWLAMLVCVAWPGGRCVRVRLGSRLRSDGRHPDLARH